MAKYVFLCLPGQGHVNPTLAVAKELVARGEEVVYYLPERFRETIETTGASFHGYQTDAENPPAPDKSRPLLTAFLFMILEESRRVIPQVLERIRADHPDYIVYDNMCLWARIVINKLHIPALLFHTSHATNEHNINLFEIQTVSKSMVEIRDDLHYLCNDYDVPLMEPLDIFLHAEPLTLAFLPRAFQPSSETFDKRFVFVGPSILPRQDATSFPLDRLGQQPILYISLGTVFNARADFFKMCFAAFKDQPWQVMLSHGTRIDPAALAPVPANFLVSPYVPQLDVLARARVFITHGGMNSTMESLYYGVPMVVIPQMIEQAVTARRVQELGLGVAIMPEELSVETLHYAVLHVAQDSSFRQRVQEMQRLAREAGGYKRAVDAIIQFSRLQANTVM